MAAIFKETWRQLKFDIALDLTRFAQRLLELPLTPRDVPFLTPNLRYPKVSGYAIVDPSAIISGRTHIRDNVKIGAGTVIRGDSDRVFMEYGAEVGSTYSICEYYDFLLTNNYR